MLKVKCILSVVKPPVWGFCAVLTGSGIHFVVRYRASSMPASSSRSVHLSEWQQNYFAVTSGACAAGRKADAYRAQILRIQYAWANSETSQLCAAKLFKKYAEKYSAIIDSDNVETGLNNYAENILTSARSQQTDSGKWQSGLSTTRSCRSRRRSFASSCSFPCDNVVRNHNTVSA